MVPKASELGQPSALETNLIRFRDRRTTLTTKRDSARPLTQYDRYFHLLRDEGFAPASGIGTNVSPYATIGFAIDGHEYALHLWDDEPDYFSLTFWIGEIHDAEVAHASETANTITSTLKATKVYRQECNDFVIAVEMFLDDDANFRNVVERSIGAIVAGRQMWRDLF